MAEANARIARVDAWLIPGLGRTIAITNASGTDWPADTYAHFGPLSESTGEVVPTIAAVTATVVGPVATVTLTEADVETIREAFPHTGFARCPWHIRTGSGAGEVAHATGFLGWDLTGSAQSATAVATVIVGPQGPTAVSADVGNAAELGTDGLLFVSPTAGSAHVIKNEGVALTNRAALNFAGAGVTVTDDAGNGATLVTIPSGGATTLDALTDVATAGQSTGKALVFDGSGWVPSSAATVLNGDSRLSDARTPTAHKVSHATGGTDALTPADIGAQPAGSYSLTSHNHTGTYAPALGADDNYVTDAEKTKLANLSGTNTGDQTLPTWSTIAGKPAVVGAGATQADARAAIGAGTSSLALGSGASQAAAGDHTHTLDALSDVSTTGATDGQALVKTPAGWAPGTVAGGGGGGATGDVQFVVARTGMSVDLASSAFTTYPLDGTPSVNTGGGTWNSSTYIYTVPSAGLYLCLGMVRVLDTNVVRSVAVGIGTTNSDGPHVDWAPMGNNAAGRDSRQYTRLARFSAGDQVRLFIYSDGVTFSTQYSLTTASGQYLSIIKLAD